MIILPPHTTCIAQVKTAFERKSLSIYELEPTHTGDRMATKAETGEFVCLFKHDLLIPCCEEFAFQVTTLVKSMKEKS